MIKKSFFLLCFFCVELQSKYFVLISAPGSGKGTFSQYMVKNHSYVQICPGDLFRKEILQQTDLGKQIQPVVESGQYVDESIVCAMMEQYVTDALKENKHFILDGFPRSPHSLRFLLNLFKRLNLTSEVLFLQFLCSDEKCVERIAGRMVCNQCAHVTHIDLLNGSEQICSECCSSLDRRKADTKAIAIDRLSYFHQHVEPVLHDANRSNFLVKRVNAEQSLDILSQTYEELHA